MGKNREQKLANGRRTDSETVMRLWTHRMEGWRAGGEDQEGAEDKPQAALPGVQPSHRETDRGAPGPRRPLRNAYSFTRPSY